MNKGLVPYVATSEYLLPSFNLDIFCGYEVVKLMEDPSLRDFHEAYLVSNSLAFGNPNLKMPNWVYIDCGLMQTAIIGFAVPVDKAPDSLIEHYERDPYVDVDKLDYIPVSGQIASLGMDGKTLIGFSLFSLRRQLGNMAVSKLAARTKYAALHAYRAEEKESFLGISQYNNNALKIHALFGEKMYIDRTMVPLHPLHDMSFTYRMKVKLDPERVFNEEAQENARYSFLLKADDRAKKENIQKQIGEGKKFHILSPVHVKQEDGLYLPIAIEG
ncbi:MAG: hypothetical protein DI626_08720 [Micavibrio aeruginosavorus]|uniref:Acetoacetate decarboxylase n=1 Tax=Micavibrio aeruginosavorus TaxID=349221 RepID=A0A2W4ZND8_9BACT|nr:MAG: hypothetical protein DI626_08720 [Micavibrio aeruginosavorus]